RSLSSAPASPPSEAQPLLDQDGGEAAGRDHSVDDEDVVHPAGHAIGKAGSLILERKAVLANAAEPRFEIRNDLLASDHEDHVLGSRSQRAQLASSRRRDQQRAVRAWMNT